MPLFDKKIVFLINTMNIGGAAKMLNFAANLCADIFSDVTIISMFEKNELFANDKRIKNVNLDIKIRGPLWRINTVSAMRKAIKAENPDIVCAFVSDVAFYARLATFGMKSVFISAERGDPYSLSPVWQMLVRYSYGKSDYCFFQLEGARDFFGKKIADKSFVIPNSYTAAENVEPFLGERKKTIVSVGRFEHQKGYDVLIDAFATVHRELPDYRLVLYGDGSDKGAYKAQVDALGLTDYVDFPGYINNAAKKIREDGVFVLPSRFEGIPNSLIEALSVGVPTVSSDCSPGGPSFLTRDGERGLLVPIDDAEALAEAIIRVIKDKELAQKFIELGPCVKDELKPEIISEMWVNAFAEICKACEKLDESQVFTAT